MALTKTPTSSLSVIELLVMIIWYRGLAAFWRYRSGRASQGVTATPPSVFDRLPQEIVEMIIAHLIYDRDSLLACSLTCRSWYMTAVAHIHHTLTTPAPGWPMYIGWPISLVWKHWFGLLPLVRRLQVRECYSKALDPFGPSAKWLNIFLVPRLYALTNVRELGIENLDIPGFLPSVQRDLEYLLPTVQSLTLREPKGCHRQILYFIGLFQHLQDLTLVFNRYRCSPEEQTGNLSLIPPFSPPLRGRLVLRFLRGGVLLKDMIKLFGGIQFRHMDLFSVDATPLLLRASSDTLETLRFYPDDPCVASFFQGHGLSQNKSLRMLVVRADTIDYGLQDPASSFLKHALSTIASPIFLEVIALYVWHDFCGIRRPCSRRDCFPRFPYTRVERVEEASRHHRQFKVFSEAQKVRDFRLVLCADVGDNGGEYSVGMLKKVVAREKAKGVLDGFSSEPTVVRSYRDSFFH